jgi:peptidoglycan/xylan/chitin deacetylase (PgdA/CDA1 family)
MFKRIAVLLTVALATPLLAVNPTAVHAATTNDDFIITRIHTTKPVVFLTIEDGQEVTAAAASMLYGIPHTNFVTGLVINRHRRYFQTDWARGATFGNHARSHIDLTKLSYLNQRREICSGRNIVSNFSGSQPILLRLPYWKYNASTIKAAKACNVSHIVFWNTWVDSTGIHRYSTDSIQRGDIIRLHYTSNLASELKVLLAELDKKGLHTGYLEDYLR